ncbi:Ldh family oxidoreductase [Georgenia deserti]|uniref:Ldh family oxidoreductase n=1 Tax=Georgenia deserti TaxID=2093781 RepID=A0ABW4L466_9MICO
MAERSASVREVASGISAKAVPLEDLTEHCAAVLRSAGLASQFSAVVAESLVDAEARGISSHGVARTRIYAERLLAGMVNGAAEPVVVREDRASAHIDARNAVGHAGANAGIRLAMSRAKEGAIGAVGVSNSNHCGTLAYFTRQAAREGLVAIAMSTAPVTMVYYGGRTRAVGTNPLSLAVPRAEGQPITVDMATSATARGKILLANQLGKAIPKGWAIDVDGRPTTDASAALAGSVTPFAGPKGSGLAMMVDLIAGAMVGGVCGDDIGDMYEDWSRPQRVGHFFIALNPDGWVGSAAFLPYVDQFAQRVHGLPPAEGFENVLLPGEVEERAYERARTDGIQLPVNVLSDLNALALEVGSEPRLASTPQ